MYKHILIATDGSELANKGVTHGVNLAQSIGATVTLVTVTENWSAMEMAEYAKRGVYNAIEDYEKAAELMASNIFNSALKQTEGKNVTVKTLHIKDNLPAEGILQAAKETGSDLIVMASHGRRGVRRLLLGSQTAEVLTLSELPVLVIR